MLGRCGRLGWGRHDRRSVADLSLELDAAVGGAAVFVGKTGLGPWQTPEMRGCLSEFVKRGLPVIPVLLPGASEQPDLPFFLEGFTWLDGPELDISGTMLRARASAGSSIRFLVPEPVAAYIEDHGVYRPVADPASP